MKELLKALKKDPYKKQIKQFIKDLKKWSKSKDVEVRIQVSSPNLRPAQRIDFKGRWGVIRRVELKDGSAIIEIPKGIYEVRLFCMKESTLTSCKNVLKLNIQEDTTLRLETDGETVKQV
jgi:ribosomal protein L21E